tara:strand:- start:756 stop:974 length:219 start_codon:yes stop_codon:yes gene_type:complete
MKNIIFIVILFCFSLNTYSSANEINCSKFQKLSVDFMKCKANLIKNKAVSKGKNFVDDTKNYQKKEWSVEKN